MSTEKCPLCDGTGNTAKEPYPYVGTRHTCHGCGGCGWINVNRTTSHAEGCPICGGKGKIHDPDHGGTDIRIVQCHGCFGLGWVTVRD